MTDTQFLCIIHLRTVGATTRNEVAPFYSFRAIAARLIGYADEIDAAGDDGDDDEREE